MMETIGTLRVAHLSRVRGPEDGGISLIVEEMLAAQRALSCPHAHHSFAWFAPPDHLSEQLKAFHPQLIHVHGLWSTPNRWIARHGTAPTVIAPQGMLDPWALAQSRWKKRIGWRLFEQRNLGRCAAVQVLSPAERDAVRALGLRSPLALIPNAVTTPGTNPVPSPGLPCRWPAQSEKVLLFLSRFHIKKGLDPLLKAWQMVEGAAHRSGWSLALAGYGDGGELERSLASAHQRDELRGVVVLGPCFGLQKLACLQAATAFVLPSFSEGLPMAALEAMAHQLPCLLSRACNLPEAFRAGAALPAEPDPAALAASLRQLFALSPSDRAAMGAAGQALVQERFSWPVVAEQTLELYRWILGGGERPGFVELG
jgi:glycosyltransferase involved in cell wall biosynthesis